MKFNEYVKMLLESKDDIKEFSADEAIKQMDAGKEIVSAGNKKILGYFIKTKTKKPTKETIEAPYINMKGDLYGTSYSSLSKKEFLDLYSDEKFTLK